MLNVILRGIEYDQPEFGVDQRHEYRLQGTVEGLRALWFALYTAADTERYEFSTAWFSPEGVELDPNNNFAPDPKGVFMESWAKARVTKEV